MYKSFEPHLEIDHDTDMMLVTVAHLFALQDFLLIC